MEKSSKRGKIPQQDWPSIISRYESGETLASIARTYDCSPPAISYIVSRTRARTAAAESAGASPPGLPLTEPQLVKATGSTTPTHDMPDHDSAHSTVTADKTRQTVSTETQQSAIEVITSAGTKQSPDAERLTQKELFSPQMSSSKSNERQAAVETRQPAAGRCAAIPRHAFDDRSCRRVSPTQFSGSVASKRRRPADAPPVAAGEWTRLEPGDASVEPERQLRQCLRRSAGLASAGGIGGFRAADTATPAALSRGPHLGRRLALLGQNSAPPGCSTKPRKLARAALLSIVRYANASMKILRPFSRRSMRLSTTIRPRAEPSCGKPPTGCYAPGLAPESSWSGWRRASRCIRATPLRVRHRLSARVRHPALSSLSRALPKRERAAQFGRPAVYP